MSDAAERAARVRRGAGWFALPDRGLVAVRGSDRIRWANGMLSNDVSALAPGPTESGCYALLLTAQGRIVADLHVLARDRELWLEVALPALPEVLARLDRYVIADDVALSDATAQWRRFALEGPRAPEVLARAAGGPVAIAPDCGVDLELGGVAVVTCAWGWSGEPAYQLFAPAAGADAVADAVAAAAGPAGLEAGDAEVIDVLRIEAGTPGFGRELGPDVLPAEAGLVGRAVSLTKGCYTGQEIVARMESRGSASHRLVGLRFAAGEATGSGSELAGAPVLADGERVGTVTSACRSASEGAIALAYVRRAHAAPGTGLSVGALSARVAPLPFVASLS